MRTAFLRGYYARVVVILCRRFGKSIGRIFSGQASQGILDTYNYLLRNNPEERTSNSDYLRLETLVTLSLTLWRWIFF